MEKEAHERGAAQEAARGDTVGAVRESAKATGVGIALGIVSRRMGVRL